MNEKERAALTRSLLRAAIKRDKALQALDDAQREIRELVVKGFAAGMPGSDLATAAGVKKARIYQIRDGVR